MSLYNYDSNIVAEQLTPPVLRKSKFLAWLYVIVKPIERLWSNFYNDYSNGVNYNVFDISTTYNFGDLVYYSKSLYEATYTDLNGVAQSFSGVECTNSDFWTLINENYIGVNERIKYNAQIIVLERALNRWYECDSGSDQIYLQNNNTVSNIFLMGDTSQYSSTMPNESVYSETYMGLVATYPDISYDYIIWVPSAVFALLGTTYDNRINNIKNFVNKYNLSGIKYKINTY